MTLKKRTGQGRTVVCGNCGKTARGPLPGTLAKGWYSKYVTYHSSIYGCSLDCFKKAKEKREDEQSEAEDSNG